jgi:putative ABC transport system substrate-binding protein
VIDRRAFLMASAAVLALGAVPLATRAQQPAKPARIAWLGFSSPEAVGHLIDAFKQGLRELGHIEGKNVLFEFRWALGKAERLPDLAKELVALKPDVIVVTTTASALAMQHATTTIPIVMTSLDDPVASGLVKSLARPGGNITGFANLNVETQPKLIELLLTVIPGLSRVALLRNPSNPTHGNLLNLQTVAQKMNVKLVLMEAQAPADIEYAFALMSREHTGAVIVHADSFFLQQRRQIAELVSRNRIPSIFASREYLEPGCLMSYGVNLSDQFHQSATYVDKILKGAKPADLPVGQPTKSELVINMKTAKALGLIIPQSMLLHADEVIQ